MASYENVFHILLTKGYLNLSDKNTLIDLQTVNKKTYLLLYSKVQAFYNTYIQSNRMCVLKQMNTLAKLIDGFEYNNNILQTKMYKYVILCYENWSWICMEEQYKTKFMVPISVYFKLFLEQKHLTMKDILPNCCTNYTHFHHQTKSSSGFKSIEL